MKPGTIDIASIKTAEMWRLYVVIMQTLQAAAALDSHGMVLATITSTADWTSRIMMSLPPPFGCLDCSSLHIGRMICCCGRHPLQVRRCMRRSSSTVACCSSDRLTSGCVRLVELEGHLQEKCTGADCHSKSIHLACTCQPVLTVTAATWGLKHAAA